MKKLLLSFATLALLVFTGCDSFVEEVDDPPDNIADAALNSADQVPFLITGVQARFAQSHDQHTLLADLLSDQAVFGNNSDATFPTFNNLDRGRPERQSNSVDNAFNVLGEYRFLADQLAERIAAIDEKDEDSGGFGDNDAALRTRALYNSYLHGGIARLFYAQYYGLEPRQGGATIGRSALIPAEEMYALAASKLDSALIFAQQLGENDNPAYKARIVNSLLAQTYLYRSTEYGTGQLDLARAAAENGLQEGDAPFQSLHSVQSSNEWWDDAGRGRSQVVAAERMRGYVEEDSTEGYILPPGTPPIMEGDPRIPLLLVEFASGEETLTEPMQDLYPVEGSPIELISWEHNELILAELDIRDGDAASAAERINSVRASHGVTPLGANETVDLSLLIEERDKELFAQGQRLVDQRRFDDGLLGFDQFPDSTPEGPTWHFLPITQQECVDNENIQCSGV